MDSEQPKGEPAPFPAGIDAVAIWFNESTSATEPASKIRLSADHNAVENTRLDEPPQPTFINVSEWYELEVTLIPGQNVEIPTGAVIRRMALTETDGGRSTYYDMPIQPVRVQSQGVGITIHGPYSIPDEMMRASADDIADNIREQAARTAELYDGDALGSDIGPSVKVRGAEELASKFGAHGRMETPRLDIETGEGTLIIKADGDSLVITKDEPADRSLSDIEDELDEADVDVDAITDELDEEGEYVDAPFPDESDDEGNGLPYDRVVVTGAQLDDTLPTYPVRGAAGSETAPPGRTHECRETRIETDAQASALAELLFEKGVNYPDRDALIEEAKRVAEEDEIRNTETTATMEDGCFVVEDEHRVGRLDPMSGEFTINPAEQANRTAANEDADDREVCSHQYCENWQDECEKHR